jgi:hypothetical protein
LIGTGPSVFEIDALMPDAGGVSLDYRDHDGKPVRISDSARTARSSIPLARRFSMTAPIGRPRDLPNAKGTSLERPHLSREE